MNSAHRAPVGAVVNNMKRTERTTMKQSTLAPRTATRLAEATVALSSEEVDLLIASLDARLERGERIFKASGVVDPDWSKTAVEVYELIDRLETVQHCRGVA